MRTFAVQLPSKTTFTLNQLSTKPCARQAIKLAPQVLLWLIHVAHTCKRPTAVPCVMHASPWCHNTIDYCCRLQVHVEIVSHVACLTCGACACRVMAAEGVRRRGVSAAAASSSAMGGNDDVQGAMLEPSVANTPWVRPMTPVCLQHTGSLSPECIVYINTAQSTLPRDKGYKACGLIWAVCAMLCRRVHWALQLLQLAWPSPPQQCRHRAPISCT